MLTYWPRRKLRVGDFPWEVGRACVLLDENGRQLGAYKLSAVDLKTRTGVVRDNGNPPAFWQVDLNFVLSLPNAQELEGAARRADRLYRESLKRRKAFKKKHEAKIFGVSG